LLFLLIILAILITLTIAIISALIIAQRHECHIIGFRGVRVRCRGFDWLESSNLIGSRFDITWNMSARTSKKSVLRNYCALIIQEPPVAYAYNNYYKLIKLIRKKVYSKEFYFAEK
jgi:hypothetical protein